MHILPEYIAAMKQKLCTLKRPRKIKIDADTLSELQGVMNKFFQRFATTHLATFIMQLYVLIEYLHQKAQAACILKQNITIST